VARHRGTPPPDFRGAQKRLDRIKALLAKGFRRFADEEMDSYLLHRQAAIDRAIKPATPQSDPTPDSSPCGERAMPVHQHPDGAPN